MSVLAGCGHKAEWICAVCANCSVCCSCAGEITPVHINTKEAAIALAKFAKKKRREYEARLESLESPAVQNLTSEELKAHIRDV